MTSIEDVKAQIEAASESARQALAGISGAVRAMDQAVEQMSEASRGSGHGKVQEALAAFALARNRLEDAGKAVDQGVQRARDYVSVI